MNRAHLVLSLCIVALLCLLATAVGRQPSLFASGSTRDPKTVSLILSDLPNGAAVVKAGSTTITNLARVVDAPYSTTLGRLGFLNAYRIEFQMGNAGPLHLVALTTELENQTSVYDNAAHARATWLAAVTTLNTSTGVRRVHVASMGEGCDAWVQSISIPGPTSNASSGTPQLGPSGFILLLYRGPFVVRIDEVGPHGAYSLDGLLKLARIVDDRIGRALRS